MSLPSPHLSPASARTRNSLLFFEAGGNLLYEKKDDGTFADLSTWQPPEEEAAGFYLLLALAALPSVRVAHALRHVDDQITRATCRDVGICVRRWKAVYATPAQPLGIERWLLSWFRLISSGELYRLGRLQFTRAPFNGPIAVFRHRESGEIVVLAANGAMFDKEGRLTDTDVPGVWAAVLEENEAGVTGAVISSSGLATEQTRHLPANEWECVLRPSDPALEVHIPEDGPIPPAACLESLNAARAFFPQKYPDSPLPKAFFCASWLLDPAWVTRLGADSNIAQFQALGHRYPVASGAKEGVYYVFYRDNPDVTTAPRDTRLQQTMLEALESGTSLRAGGMFIL